MADKLDKFAVTSEVRKLVENYTYVPMPME